jgi:L-alanine-DL-glutamate epimerase-like enolase superfamily enzyme
LVVAEVQAGGYTGVGYTYSDAAAAQLINGKLRDAVIGIDATAVPQAMAVMLREVRNLGRAGLAATAISAVDTALWDLKGKLLGQPVVIMLGAKRDCVPLYGSGGFTTYSLTQLKEQLGGWAEEGMRWVKMKIGTDPAADPERVAAA